MRFLHDNMLNMYTQAALRLHTARVKTPPRVDVSSVFIFVACVRTFGRNRQILIDDEGVWAERGFEVCDTISHRANSVIFPSLCQRQYLLCSYVMT